MIVVSCPEMLDVIVSVIMDIIDMETVETSTISSNEVITDV